MGYTEIDVVVAGALDESIVIYDESDPEGRNVETELHRIEREARQHVGPDGLTEVYLIRHEHPMLTTDDECSCVQYLTDHHPYLTVDPEQPECRCSYPSGPHLLHCPRVGMDR